MLRAILNKSWRQHPTRRQLYGHLPPITKTILVRRARHAGHCWRSKDEIVSDVLLWTPTYGQAKAGRPARTYIQQLCEDTGCNPEDLPEVMNDREKRREMVKDIRAGGTSWWWWWSCSLRLFTFYTLPDTRVFNSFEELWIMRVAAVNSFARMLTPHHWERSHSQTDCFVVSPLFRVATPARCSKLDSKPSWLYVCGIFYSRAITFPVIVREFLTHFFFTYTLSAIGIVQFLRRVIAFQLMW